VRNATPLKTKAEAVHSADQRVLAGESGTLERLAS